MLERTELKDALRARRKLLLENRVKIRWCDRRNERREGEREWEIYL